MIPPELLGVAAALGSAASWALGSILFRHLATITSPLGLNLAKCLMGLVLLGVALGLLGATTMSWSAVAWLLASGLLGIAVGDTLFFMTLVRLEPRRTVLLATVGQVFTVFLAVLLLGERPNPLAWPGIVLVIMGVHWVMMEQVEDADVGRTREGLLLGLASALCMSGGILLAKVGVADVGAVQGTLVRLVGATVGLLAVGGLQGSLRDWLMPFREPKHLTQMTSAVAVIIFGGFTLSLLALKLVDASVASVLNSTEPLFILPLAAILLEERITSRMVLGSLVAVAGVGLIIVSL